MRIHDDWLDGGRAHCDSGERQPDIAGENGAHHEDERQCGQQEEGLRPEKVHS